MPTKTENIFTPFDKQDDFMTAALSYKYNFLLLGGSIRAGKTMVILVLLILLCKIYPGSKWYVIRRDVPTLKRTTIPTFHLVCPIQFLESFNRSDLVATMTNGSCIYFMGENASEDPDCNRFKGLEANGFFLSQAEELRELTFDTCKMRYGQWKLPEWRKKPEMMPPKLIFLDVNPTQTWCKKVFYDKHIAKKLKAPYYCQLISIFDNPHLDADYLESLKTLPKEIYDRYVKALWDALDSLNQLVPWEAIHQCSKAIISSDETMSLGADIGHSGNDPTVMYLLKGPNVYKKFSYPKTRTTECRDIILKHQLEYSIASDHICVDAVGVGAGVVDELHERKVYVIAMKGGAREILKRCVHTQFKFTHWKAWSYWIAAEALKNKQIGNFNDELLKSDAGAIWYFIKNDMEIKTEGKDDLRKRIGRSCDDWDAFVYAWWAYKQHEILGGIVGIYTSTDLANDNKKEQEAMEATA